MMTIGAVQVACARFAIRIVKVTISAGGTVWRVEFWTALALSSLFSTIASREVTVAVAC